MDWCHILGIDEIVENYLDHGLVGAYRLYDDGTESLIETPIVDDELIKDLRNGVQYGFEFTDNYHGYAVERSLKTDCYVITYEDGYVERINIGE